MLLRIRRPLIYTHRWLGIVGGILVLVWFASGIVLMYARMPQLTPTERLARSPVLNLSAATVEPHDAAPGLRSPDAVRIGMLADRPVYRFLDGAHWFTIAADTGRQVEDLSKFQAEEIVRRFAPGHEATIAYESFLADADQWTFGVRGLMPLHKVSVGDAPGTEVYVSDRTVEPVMVTTASGRRWGYLGAVMHWLYFTPLRRQGGLWAQSVIWLSIAGCVLTATGLVWGVWRYSPSVRYRLKRVPARSPYAGFMHWHHYAGLFFGVTTLTWLFSGLLSMDPWSWSPGTSPTRAQRDAVSGGPLRLERLTLQTLRDAVDAAPGAVTELEVLQFQGEMFVRPLTGGDEGGEESAAAEGVRFDEAALVEAARLAMPGVAVTERAWLERYDAYYYSRYGALPLPMLRVKFDDPQATWLYLDPRRGTIARKEERLSRLNRWLYHGLHSLDFPFLYYRRPLWDAVVIGLSAGGIVVTVTSFVPAWRRLRRHTRHIWGGVGQAGQAGQAGAGKGGPGRQGGPGGQVMKRTKSRLVSCFRDFVARVRGSEINETGH